MSSTRLVAVASMVAVAFPVNAFWTPTGRRDVATRLFMGSEGEELRERRKAALLSLIDSRPESTQEDGDKYGTDPVLACPDTRNPLVKRVAGPILGGRKSSGVRVVFQTVDNKDGKVYSGRTDSYYNLLKADPMPREESNTTESTTMGGLRSLARSTIISALPPPVRLALTSTGLVEDDYILMRDLFTSPAVSYAYERGWREGFAQGGFPGADKEFELACEYFEPSMKGRQKTTVVDMSCATGLFTRRFAKSEKFDRVLGCDYSESMLLEARNRIRADREIAKKDTQLELVQCDVGRIPMLDNSVDALHAGAAMHCWPDLPLALSEIHRVLRPGGRYFATTFLSSYFRVLQASDGNGMGTGQPSQTYFQYFSSVDQLRKLLVDSGFEEDKVKVEVLKPACVIIRCEK